MITPDDVADWTDEAKELSNSIWECIDKNELAPFIALSACLWTSMQICSILNSEAEDVDMILEALKERYRKMLAEKHFRDAMQKDNYQ